MNEIFNGDRLRFARQYRGMTIEELGTETGLSKQNISQYENFNGKDSKGSSPNFATVFNIANVLSFPKEFFYQKDQYTIKTLNTYFRALLTSKMKDKTSQINKSIIISLIYYILNDYIEFPTLNIPDFDLEKLTDEKISHIADELRNYWKIGEEPIDDMIYLMESNGIIITSLSTNSETIDAFTQYININNTETFCVALENEKTSSARRQFSAAHELGHIVLHSKSGIDMENIDRAEFREIERQANLFASEFLLPKNEFAKDLIDPNSLKCYEILKRKWKVSIFAMIIRAYNLQLITYSQYQYLIRQYTVKKYRGHEPLDNVQEINQPQLLKNAIEMLIENNVFSPKEFLKELSLRSISLSGREIEEILNLKKGTLTTNYIEEKKVLKIDFKKR